ncbi:transposase zinc-binding domain-containing protein [bacterium]|nr:transposase zinc-binding domain-containing protein [bacterium]
MATSPQKEQFVALSFSCKGRCCCPACQAKRAIILDHHLNENVLFLVPHRQYVFSIPKMLRIYFKYDRSLLGGLCQCAWRSLLTFLREVVGLKDGVPGAVLAIHTFGADPAKWHPQNGIHTSMSFPQTGFSKIQEPFT